MVDSNGKSASLALAGGLALADGPLPFGDLLASGIVVYEGGKLVYNNWDKLSNGAKKLWNSVFSKKNKGKEKSKGNVGQKTFPNNPNDFNPKGLEKKTYNTKNGKIIKWFDKKGKAKYEWDEDKAYGSHYHIIGPNGNTRISNSNGETHFNPGDPILE